MRKKIKNISIFMIICMLVLGLFPGDATAKENSAFSFSGDARMTSDKIIELTPLETWKRGSIWYNSSYDISGGMTLSFDYWAGGGHDDFYGGADGFVVMLSPQSRLGYNGEDMGFVGCKGAYGIEFDSYSMNTNDPDGKHIAIIKDSVTNHLTSKITSIVDDERWHTASVTYKDSVLQVSVDGKSMLSYKITNLPEDIYIGISAATGSGYNRHLIRNLNLNLKIPTIKKAKYYKEEDDSEKAGTGIIELEFEKNWLLDDARNYNHNLALFAAGMATMSYDESGNSVNMFNALSKLGFSGIDTVEDKDGNISPYWIAHKNTKINGKDTEIVMVVIRGTKDKEWIDNFEPGYGKTHKGFQRAADYVYKGIGDQIQKWAENKNNPFDLKADLKLIITGHSRGAAAANLLGKKIDDKGIVSSDKKYLKVLPNRDVFVYTFATPNVTSKSDVEDYNYTNIYNIVNPEDFVTKVLLKDWGYSRYGTTYVLPSKSTERAGKENYVDYNTYLKKLKSYFKTYRPQSNGYTPYKNGMGDLMSYVDCTSKIVKNVEEYYD